MKNYGDLWIKDNIGISNSVWINKRDKIVRKNYDKNEFALLYGNQERKILSYLKEFKILNYGDEFIEINYFESNSINSNNLSDRLIKKIAKKIEEIHRININDIKDLKNPNFKNVWKFLKNNENIPKLLNEEFYFEEAMKLLNKDLAISNNDITDGNVLVDKNDNIIIIDFEYGGLNNYLFDIASFIVKRQITKKQEVVFLDEYFKLKEIKIPNEEFLIVRKFTSYFWAKWAYFKYLQTNDEVYIKIFFWLKER